MKQPTLEDLADFLSTVDRFDDEAATAARTGHMSLDDARDLLNANAACRAYYLDQAFRIAHVAAHAEKCHKAREAAARKVA